MLPKIITIVILLAICGIISISCVSRDDKYLHPRDYYNEYFQISHFLSEHYQRCSAYSPCPDAHHRCREGVCKCEPNYRYSVLQKRCVHYYCHNDSMCHSWDPNRYCSPDSGECLCAQGYDEVHHTKSGLVCRKTFATYGKPCLTSDNCQHREACVDGICRCAANYAISHTTGRCESYLCDRDKDCQQYDKDRRCNRYGECVCKDLYRIDFNNGHKCTLVTNEYGSVCQHSCNDPDLKCVDSLCRCAPNFLYNRTSQKCVHFRCQRNADCQTYDEYRGCDAGTGMCVCATNYYASRANGLKCHTTMPLTVVFIISGTVLLMSVCFFVGKCVYVRYSRNAMGVVPITCHRQVRETPLLSGEGTRSHRTENNHAYLFDPPPPYSECVNNSTPDNS